MSGIRIVDCSTVLSGPLATTVLADQGADVIKVEAPGAGDLTRHVTSRSHGVTAMYQVANRGKRSMVVDVRVEGGLDVMRRLVATADVFVQNFRPGVADRIGVGYEALRSVRDDLVYVSIAGFGFHGPLAGLKVYDNMIQAASGFTVMQADSDGQPKFVRNLICDKLTALTAAQAMTAALFARTRGAGGQHIEIAMLDVAVTTLWTDAVSEYTWLEPDAQRIASTGSYDVTRYADGWGTAVPLTDDEFRGLCAAYGVPEVADDPRFATMADRVTHPDYAGVYRDVIQPAAAKIPVAEVMQRLERAGVAAVAVVTPSELADHPQIVANDTLEETTHPVGGRLRQPRPPARFSVTPALAGAPAPQMGQHTDELLVELGYDRPGIAALRSAGAVA